MSKPSAELIKQYTVQTFNDPTALREIFLSFGSEAIDLMCKRSTNSSVPLFLGDLISNIREEVRPQIKRRRKYALGNSPIGVILVGGSSLLPTETQETAYRVYSCKFPTDWAAAYALVYGSGVAYAKAYQAASVKHEEMQAIFEDRLWHYREFIGTMFFSPSLNQFVRPRAQLVIPCSSTDVFKADQDSQEWGSVVNQMQENTSSFGGYTLFMEIFAGNYPPDLLDNVRHRVAKLRYRFPTVNQLEEIRGKVDHHFDDRAKTARAFMEAQRLQVPSLTLQ